MGSAPQWLKDRMEASRKRPLPTAEQVGRQFRAVERHVLHERIDELIKSLEMTVKVAELQINVVSKEDYEKWLRKMRGDLKELKALLSEKNEL